MLKIVSISKVSPNSIAEGVIGFSMDLKVMSSIAAGDLKVWRKSAKKKRDEKHS